MLFSLFCPFARPSVIFTLYFSSCLLLFFCCEVNIFPYFKDILLLNGCLNIVFSRWQNVGFTNSLVFFLFISFIITEINEKHIMLPKPLLHIGWRNREKKVSSKKNQKSKYNLFTLIDKLTKINIYTTHISS